jgi:hypothetical protein
VSPFGILSDAGRMVVFLHGAYSNGGRSA